MNPLDLRILFISQGSGGSPEYRCHTPIAGLRHLGVKADHFDPDKARVVPINYDIYVIWGNLRTHNLDIIRSMRAVGKCVITDIDDYHRGVPQTAAVYPAFGNHSVPIYSSMVDVRDADGRRWLDAKPAQSPEMNNTIIEATIALSDGLTCSTPELARLHAHLNRNIYVLENCLDLEHPAWKNIGPHVEEPGTVRIGWCGSHCHRDDIDIVVEPVKEIMAEFPETQLLIGSDSHALTPFYEIAEDRKRYIKAVPFEQYPKLMLRQFDIGLVPLVQNEFTRSKSAAKGMEYAAAGVPMVASPSPAYMRWLHPVEGEIGFIASGKAMWVEKLRRLVSDRKLRRKLGKAGQKYAQLSDIRLHAETYLATYAEIYRRSRLAPSPILIGR